MFLFNLKIKILLMPIFILGGTVFDPPHPITFKFVHRRTLKLEQGRGQNVMKKI